MSKAIGIDKIEYGTVGDGVPASVFTELAESIVEDSVGFNFVDPTETNLMKEDSDIPYHTLTSKDAPESIEFSVYAPSAANLLILMGGTTTAGKWEAPPAIPEINKTWKITTPSIGGEVVEYTIVNGKTLAHFDKAPGKKASETVIVRVILQAAITAAGAENTPYIREIV